MDSAVATGLTTALVSVIYWELRSKAALLREQVTRQKVEQLADHVYNGVDVPHRNRVQPGSSSSPAPEIPGPGEPGSPGE